MLDKIKKVISKTASSWATRVAYNAGLGVDRLFAKESEARGIVAKSNSFEEFVSRINLRLGVTYPDVPLPGNEAVSVDDSLANLALHLFTLRHFASGSISGTKMMAASHEGDRQIWHSMTSDNGADTTNADVRSKIFIYLEDLYAQSRHASPQQRWWYYGRMLHCLQDSYSDSHVARNEEPSTYDAGVHVHFFQDYSSQVGAKHALSDSSPQQDEKRIKQAEQDGEDQSDEIKTLKQRLPRKRILYAEALRMSSKVLRALWYNTRRSETSPADDLWVSKLQPIFGEVFSMGLTQWSTAPTGGSLPTYANDGRYSERQRKEMAFGVELNARHVLDRIIPSAYLNVILTKIRAFNVPTDADVFSATDPYIRIVSSATGQAVQTRVLSKSAVLSNREAARSGRTTAKTMTYEWNMRLSMRLADYASISIVLYDADNLRGVPQPSSSELLAQTMISAVDFLDGSDRIDGVSKDAIIQDRQGRKLVKRVKLKSKDGKPTDIELEISMLVPDKEKLEEITKGYFSARYRKVRKAKIE
jgi:hypothetical protein